MLIKRLRILLCALFFPLCAQAQEASQPDRPVCSVITVAPGDSLDALFGHTAIRIRDERLEGGDVWFDYGVFDPSDWTFWIHYAKGDAKYLLMAFHSEKRFNDYKEEGREVTEQVLDLTPEEGRKLENYLIRNLRHPEYEYRFLDDNCTTRAKGAIEAATGEKIEEKYGNYRNYTDWYLSANPFAQFGANLLMGVHADREAHVFLPILLEDAIQNSPRYSAVPQKKYPLSFYTNRVALRHLVLTDFFFVGGAILFLSLAIPTLLRHKKRKPLPRRAYLDSLLFLAIGLIGCLMTFLGFWSHHPELGAFNWNLIWCWPTHVPFALVLLVRAHSPFVRTYARVACVGASCAALAYFFVPQALPVPLFPLVLLLAVRAWRWGWATVA